jgi:cytochrome c
LLSVIQHKLCVRQKAFSGKIDKSLKPNQERGVKIYQAQCASCHGDNGEGKKDNQGHIAFPPLWGDKSFNIGAGMARTYTAAAFIKGNMPIGQPNSLSDQLVRKKVGSR